MDSWDQQTPSPQVKYETSPAESFLSAPGEMYPSLFESTPAAAGTTMNPLDIMTPESYSEDRNADVDTISNLGFGLGDAEASSPAPSGEKKQTKKRKSWGQVLPEPKTNLPPRKRAKTEDEKEQRRVERVLRNRRAAQSSRERKRLEVEALEKRNKDLEVALLHVQKMNFMLVEELNNLRRSSGVVTRSPASLDSLRANPVTLSQELFSSHDGHGAALEQAKSSIVDELLMSSQASTTVNPASLSPELNPISDEDVAETAEEAMAATPAAEAVHPMVSASPDLTQHPAEMLCDGLQCQSVDAPQWSVAASQRSLVPALLLSLQLQLLVASTSAALSLCRRPLTQIAMSLRAGFSLPPAPSILNTIIWLVTTPRPSRSRPSPPPSSRPPPSSTPSTLTSSSTRCPPPTPSRRSSSRTASTAAAASSPIRRPSSTLRLNTLRRILTSSPNLARPLMDATIAVLRSVSSEGRNVERVSRGTDGSAREVIAAVGDMQQPRQQLGVAAGSAVSPWQDGQSAPSKEALLTLLWVLRVEEKKIAARQTSVSSGPGMAVSVTKTMTPTIA